VTESLEPIDLLWDWLRSGWAYRLAQGNERLRTHKDEYLAQLNLEMELIDAKNFVSYFLLVSDLVRWAKDHGIAVGPGRGSSAASVVCYLLRITEPDPLQFPLTDFSRFVDPTRMDLPDIDIDFDDTRRHEVREYAVAKFGAANVGSIATFTKYKAKNSLVDVARVFGIPAHEVRVIKDLAIERSGGDSRADASLLDTIDTFPAAKAVYERYPDIYKAIRLEGNYRGMSVHAAGLVIADRPIAEICAMYTRENKSDLGELLTSVSVDKYNAEYLGLMKIDLLGLSTMGMIATCLGMIGMTLEELYRLPYDDPATLSAFNTADVVGVFQFEGRATRLVCRNVAPENFLDLVDINALSRPGPFFSGTTSEYTDVRHGRRKATKIHPVIDEITAGTRGQIIYQEQILHALARFGGLSVQRVHEIRRIISQKLGEAQFNTSAKAFAENASRLHGVTEELAMEVWGRVVTSASYAFVYSHSLAYTIIGYWCMWLKVHHPAEFYASQLQKMDKDRWPRMIRDAARHVVQIEGVRPGLSQATWSVNRQSYRKEGKNKWKEEVRVYAGWTQLNGVGDALAKKVLVAQSEGLSITKAEDLLKVSGFGPAKVAALREQIDSDDPFGLQETKNMLDAVRTSIRRRELVLPRPTVISDLIQDLRTGQRCVWVGRVKTREYKDIFEDERARTGDSLEDIRKRIKRPDLATACVLHCYDDGEEDVYLRIPRFDFPKFKLGLAAIDVDNDVIHVVAQRGRGSFGAALYVLQLTIIDPEDDPEEEETS
jgi:DNA polymerase-3 subunit alpha